MRPSRSLPRSLTCAAGALVLIAAPGCVKEISSEERLDRETRTVPLEEAGGQPSSRRSTARTRMSSSRRPAT